MTLHRCTNSECQLYGVRVWTAAGSAYTCQCGDLALAREALKRTTDTTRRPA